MRALLSLPLIMFAVVPAAAQMRCDLTAADYASLEQAPGKFTRERIQALSAAEMSNLCRARKLLGDVRQGRGAKLTVNDIPPRSYLYLTDAEERIVGPQIARVLADELTRRALKGQPVRPPK